MRCEGYYDSHGEGKIHYIEWIPEKPVRAVVLILHGMAEPAERYESFAEYLNGMGYLVAAEDHMGHGKSVYTCQGYFKGGWFSVVRDSMTLFYRIRSQYPAIPFAFFGHSMGSFLLRTILCMYPQENYQAAIISGTGWHMKAELLTAATICRAVCKAEGDVSRSPFLNCLILGSYNQKVEHKRTEFDWLTRNQAAVDAYIENPDCGFPLTAGLFRDLMEGILFIEGSANMQQMKKQLPVLFTAGTMDPVGSYGKGVRKSAEAFKKNGMKDISLKLYPLCRHELLNEINRDEIYRDLSCWLEEKLFCEELL